MNTPHSNIKPFLVSGGGATGDLFRSIDWSQSPLGPTHTWPASLRLALTMLFNSHFPMFLWWGKDMVQFYNDAYLPSLGSDRHPHAMGQPGHLCWPESWHIIYPQIAEVMKEGKPTWYENANVPFYRNGTIENMYWNYGYTPVFESEAIVGGVLLAGHETTLRVIAETSVKEKHQADRARRAAENIKAAIENERENLRTLFHQSPEIVCITSGPEHTYEFVNEAHIRMLGFDATGMTIREAQPESVEFYEMLDRVYHSGAAERFEEIPITVGGIIRYFNLTYSGSRAQDGTVIGVLMLGLEVTDQVTSREALKMQKRALELTLDGAPVNSILEVLVRAVETQSANSIWGSVCLVDSDGKNLSYGAAPSLPEEYFKPGDLLPIGPHNGSCGSAAYHGRPVIVTDIATDPKWANTCEKPLKFGFKACWSTPIFSSQDKILGTFELYFKTCRQPMASEMQLVDIVTHTAALVIERKNSQKDLEQAKDQAEAASATKSSFLANMSHEIRTPLGAIMGFVDLMKHAKSSPQDIEKFTTIISRNSQQLLRIIDDILDLSKVEAGKMLIEQVDFSLNTLLADFCSLMAVRAQESGINLNLTTTTAIPEYINTDPIRLRQILTNVVGNAIKFTEKGSVDVSVAYRAPLLEIKVSDTGRGISPEQAQKLFQPFTQADASTTRKFGGTGLGLVLSRSLAKALGGDFWMESSEVSKGSTFIATIKIGVPFYSRFLDQPIISFSGSSGHHTLADSSELEGMNILLVEDSPDNQTLISILLSKSGAKPDIASNGRLGVEKALAGNYDLVLMDIQMPQMDGHEATRYLRSRGFGRPIIALTAHAMKEERERCMASGFSDFITKPVQQRPIINTILKHKKSLAKRSVPAAPLSTMARPH